MPHPAVIIMTVYFSIFLMATSYMLTTNSFIYQQSYGFTIKQTALTSFAPLIAVWIAIPYVGSPKWVSESRQLTFCSAELSMTGSSPDYDEQTNFNPNGGSHFSFFPRSLHLLVASLPVFVPNNKLIGSYH